MIMMNVGYETTAILLYSSRRVVTMQRLLNQEPRLEEHPPEAFKGGPMMLAKTEATDDQSISVNYVLP